MAPDANRIESSQIANFMRPTWMPSGSCRPQMGPTLAPWTLRSEVACCDVCNSWQHKPDSDNWGIKATGRPVPLFNVNMMSHYYRKSHTHYYRISHTGKTASLYWIKVLEACILHTAVNHDWIIIRRLVSRFINICIVIRYTILREWSQHLRHLTREQNLA